MATSNEILFGALLSSNNDPHGSRPPSGYSQYSARTSKTALVGTSASNLSPVHCKAPSLSVSRANGCRYVCTVDPVVEKLKPTYCAYDPVPDLLPLRRLYGGDGARGPLAARAFC
nr:hypothetical protein CFP56_30047 [Quercus suber]